MQMTNYGLQLLGQTRRHFFNKCFVGLGNVALAQLLRGGGTFLSPLFIFIRG